MVYSNVSTITVNQPASTEYVPNIETDLPSNQNYIATWTATAPVSNPNLLVTKPLMDVKLSVQYFDGLGRLLQSAM